MTRVEEALTPRPPLPCEGEGETGTNKRSDSAYARRSTTPMVIPSGPQRIEVLHAPMVIPSGRRYSIPATYGREGSHATVPVSVRSLGAGSDGVGSRRRLGMTMRVERLRTERRLGA